MTAVVVVVVGLQECVLTYTGVTYTTVTALPVDRALSAPPYSQYHAPEHLKRPKIGGRDPYGEVFIFSSRLLTRREQIPALNEAAVFVPRC